MARWQAARAAAVGALALALVGGVASAALAADGELDPAFSADGIATARLSESDAYFDSASAVAVRSDGAVYVAGGANAQDFSRMNRPMLSRFTATGQLDATFGTAGVVRSPVGYEAGWRDVAATADGGAIVLGYGDEQRWTVAKLTSAGAFDTGFSGDGVATGPGGEDGPDSEQAFQLLLQPDGKALVVGLSCQRFGTNACESVLVQRLRVDGAPDPTFGTGGTAVVDTGLLSRDVGAALAPDGKLVLAAPGYLDAGAVFGTVVGRLTTSGQLDPSFDGDGLRRLDDVESDLVEVDSAGRPVLAWTTYDPGTRHHVRRLTAAGAEDATYGTAGPLDTSSWSSSALIDVERMADDTIVLVGSDGSSAEGATSYARVTGISGGPDTRLSADGEVTLLLGGSDFSRFATDGALDAAGRLHLSGIDNVPGPGGDTLVARVSGPAVGAVTGLSALPSAGALAVSWTAPSGLAPTSYDVELTPGAVRSVTGTSTTLAGLENGLSHSVRVRAVNAAGPGSWSAPVSGAPNGCAPSRFSDVAANHPFCSDISWMASQGISTGTVLPDGSVEYRPSLPVSRQAMAPFLYRASGSPAFAAPATASFADVPTTHAFFREIEWMRAEGISTGTAQPTGLPLYKPGDAVSRQAMAPFLYRASGSPAFAAPATASFADVPTTHPFFREIEWMRAEGISTGTAQPTGLPLYKPGDAVSRQAMAAFLHRSDVGAPS